MLLQTFYPSFQKADMKATSANRQRIDRTIHNIAGVNYRGCPDAWRQVESFISEDEASFFSKLKAEWKKREHTL
jgi:hypothetical protein